MSVSAIIATRGDVDLQRCMEPFPHEWEVLVWDNGAGKLSRWFWHDGVEHGEQFDPFWQHDMSVRQVDVADLSVYGRYAAIEYASHDLIYVQDDDVIVSDPQAIVDEWHANGEHREHRQKLLEPWDFLAANMPQEFRHDGYTDSCLVGFGACFHRDAPARAFDRMLRAKIDFGGLSLDYGLGNPDGWMLRTCDVVFTTLTPRVLVDVPKINREFAEDANRMYRQPGHVGERARMLELARKVRDAR